MRARAGAERGAELDRGDREAGSVELSVGTYESPDSFAWPAEPTISASATSIVAVTAERRARRETISADGQFIVLIPCLGQA